jgi:mono/diheme cytochrome c family protein
MKAIALFCIVVAPLTLAACGGPAPESAREAEEAGPGQALYERDCAMCHGIDGEASRIGRGAVDLNDPEWQRRTSIEQIERVIAEGQGQMPAWESRFSEEEIRAVAEYVKSLR